VALYKSFPQEDNSRLPHLFYSINQYPDEHFLKLNLYVMFLKGILVSLALLGSINAAVIRNSPERRATQSCTATNHAFFVSYSVLIRVPYGGKSDCDATFHALTNAGPIIAVQDYEWDAVPLTNWQCVESNGNIQLWFNCAGGQGSDINSALESRYTSVGEFNCPDG